MQNSTLNNEPVSTDLPIKTMTPDELNQTLIDWKAAKETLIAAKSTESELRKKIVTESGMFDPKKQSGTQRVPLGDQGWQIKAVKKLTYKVTNNDGEAFTILQQLAAMGEVSAFKAEGLFKFDANLSLSKYKELNPEELNLVNQIIETKPGTPTLELVPPKS